MKLLRNKPKQNPGTEEILAVQILRSSDSDLNAQAQLCGAESEVERQFVEIRREAEEAENITPEILGQIVRCV